MAMKQMYDAEPEQHFEDPKSAGDVNWPTPMMMLALSSFKDENQLGA
jgi:hypothetical protein